MKQVIATAGHVDHGKSTLIRTLTGIEPDRWSEEKRRGLTIDLGFAWTELPSGREVSFVDVPGHERFLGNMLAGLGPAPIVCFVLAADEGWQAQSSEHRAAHTAHGIDHGLLVVTRTDLAPDRVEPVIAQARTELAGTSLAEAPAIAVSAVTGAGMDQLRVRLDEVISAAPQPAPTDRVRLWVDRSFTISGAGTVVTGTLAAGSVRPEDRLQVAGARRDGEVIVRGVHSRGGPAAILGPVSRAAVNLRGVDPDDLGRGDALLTPGAWELTPTVDVRRMTGAGFDESPAELIVHVGTAAVTARVRPLGSGHARLALERALPLAVGDRMVLRGSGSRSVRTGAHVLDVDPPALSRRGDGRRRGGTLAEMPLHGDVAGEVSRRGAVRVDTLARRGLELAEDLGPEVRREGDWLLDPATFRSWTSRLQEMVEADRMRDPLSAGIPRKVALETAGVPDAALLDRVVSAADLTHREGRIRSRDEMGLGAAEQAVAILEQRLGTDPFRAPEAHDLADLHLGAKELAAAARQGRLLRLPGEVILAPAAAALAMRELSRLRQPFTLSQARQALGTTRRVAVPLLEHLDARGWSRRLDAGHREIVR